MYTLINGSPKAINSNSLYFLKLLGNSLDNFNIYNLKIDSYEEIINNIELSDTIVLAFPLYVDCPTSMTLEFLDYIYDNKIFLNKKNLYVIINCGFKEGEQNITALNIIKRWCYKVNANYKGAILIGAGEIVGKPKYKLICRKALKYLKEFSTYVKDQKKCNEYITTMDILDNKTYCYLANKSWNKRGKVNKLTKKDIIVSD